MFLFKKRNKLELDPNELYQIPLTEEPAVNYNTVLDYIIGLSRQDFDKLNKVAVIYRTANKEANRVLGNKEEPATSIKDETPAPVSEIEDGDDIATSLLDDAAMDFIMDDAPVSTPNTEKSKKIEVKDK